MGVLGKDLFELDFDYFRITARFAADEIEIFRKRYSYAQITTDFLNYDPAEFYQQHDALIAAFSSGDRGEFWSAYENIFQVVKAMPLFCDNPSDGIVLQIEKENPAKDVSPLPDPRKGYLAGYYGLRESLELIHTRYDWFLKKMFTKQSQSKTYAAQLEDNLIAPYTTGISLGLSMDVDPSPTGVQFEIAKSPMTDEPMIYEKRTFRKLIDFIYTDLFRGMMIGNVPKVCKNCGRFFLQEKGISYEYCYRTLESGSGDQTCRDVGAIRSFRKKVKTNEVWQIHQRAYKKYYARVLKNTMTRSDFDEWAQEAEKLRDQTLELWRRAKKEEVDYSLEEYAAMLNEK